MSTTRAALAGLLALPRLQCKRCSKPATYGHNSGGRYCWTCASVDESELPELYELQEKAAVEAAERALATTAEPDPLREKVIALCDTIEAADANAAHPTGGMQVTFFGDFAQLPPSARIRLRWWARELREALGVTVVRQP